MCNTARDIIRYFSTVASEETLYIVFNSYEVTREEADVSKLHKYVDPRCTCRILTG